MRFLLFSVYLRVSINSCKGTNQLNCTLFLPWFRKRRYDRNVSLKYLDFANIIQNYGKVRYSIAVPSEFNRFGRELQRS